MKEAITTEATRAVESNRRFMRPAVNVVIVAVDSVEINGLQIRAFWSCVSYWRLRKWITRMVFRKLRPKFLKDNYGDD